MNSTLSQELSAMLSQLLEGERKETWTWLRAKMDPLLDLLAHSIYHRLDTQLLTNGTIPRIGMRDDDDWAQLLNPFAQIESRNVIAHQQFVDSLIDDIKRSPPVKKARLDTTPPNNASPMDGLSGVSSGYSTVDSQPYPVNIPSANLLCQGVIAVQLQCPQSGCGAVFARQDQLREHLSGQHLLAPFQCAVKDCGQSFYSIRSLGGHVKQSHKHTTQWHCGKCPKHYTKYRRLSRHNIYQHQQGLFRCALEACTFTADYRGKVTNHYNKKHKTTMN